MYRILWKEEGVSKFVWCYGRECSIQICQSLYQSPYVYTIVLYDADDNIINIWGYVD